LALLRRAIRETNQKIFRAALADCVPFRVACDTKRLLDAAELESAVQSPPRTLQPCTSDTGMPPPKQLLAFLTETMSMTDIYQPAVILHLLEHGGTASKRELARTLSSYDRSVQEDYEKVLMRWPKITLTKHGIVKYDQKQKLFKLAFDLADEDAVIEAKKVCQTKIKEWLEKQTERDPAAGVGASVRYRVLQAARGRCELCGISSKLALSIDIDHIVPRNHADKQGFIIKDGIRMPLDDERNLQALCFRCNRAKRDQDNTDFRLPQRKLVRDRIPDLISASGRTPVTKSLKGRELIDGLLEKLVEEHAELLASESLDEITDMIEVLFALAKQLGYNEAAVLSRRKAKRYERGGFDRALYLTHIVSQDGPA
jgi:predicted house-cleaning noncanonical NTP pyrophosphatase (MazG superfamily)